MVLGFNHIKRFPVWIGFALFVLFFTHTLYAVVGDGPVGAENAVDHPLPTVHTPRLSGDVPQGDEKLGTGDIHISADKLISSRDDATAEFSGNVLATQVGATIRSDRLMVHYDKVEDEKAATVGADKGSGRMGSNRIQRIIAEGNVKIEMNNRIAFCDRAVYHVADGLIILSGNDVRLSEADNYIHGRQITLNRLTGAISVSGDPEKRVEAVFNPGTEKTPAVLRPQKTD